MALVLTMLTLLGVLRLFHKGRQMPDFPLVSSKADGTYNIRKIINYNSSKNKVFLEGSPQSKSILGINYKFMGTIW